MKCTLIAILLTIVACTTTNANLQQDFNEIGNLLPKAKIVFILGKHLFDGELKNFRKFAMSGEFGKVWETLIKNQKFRNVIQYVQESGVDAVGALNELSNLLHTVKYPRTMMISSRSVMSFIDDVLKALPKDKISQLMKNKMKSSPEFKKFHDRLINPDFHNLIVILQNAPELSGSFQTLQSKGFNIEKVLRAGKDILSWAN